MRVVTIRKSKRRFLIAAHRWRRRDEICDGKRRPHQEQRACNEHRLPTEPDLEHDETDETANNVAHRDARRPEAEHGAAMRVAAEPVADDLDVARPTKRLRDAVEQPHSAVERLPFDASDAENE